MPIIRAGGGGEEVRRRDDFCNGHRNSVARRLQWDVVGDWRNLSAQCLTNGDRPVSLPNEPLATAKPANADFAMQRGAAVTMVRRQKDAMANRRGNHDGL